MIARSMDLRGEHREAERFLEPMLRFQGHEALTGRFTTKEGAFHSAGQYTHGQYAMDHGFVLLGVAEHYLMTRDRAYLDRVAPQLIAACNFLYWLATNACFYLGMKRTAQALAEIRPAEAARIAQEAEAYRRDIERAARQSATMAAAVRLRDGTFVPYVPSRVGQWRHLTEGWIREALYPALHLATAEVVSPADPLMTWILDDLEDNILFSVESGYHVADLEKTWFERGGVTLQPCLLDAPPIYMARNEINACLRSFWNTYAMSIYPDVQCFAEWVPRFGSGGGPLYKTSDEARFAMWLRQLLVWENGDHLWFGRAIPRQWLEDGKTVRIQEAATSFGTAGMVLQSEIGKGRIHASLQLCNPPPPSCWKTRSW